MPRDVPVDVRSGEILYARLAELFGGGCVGMPYNHVRAVRKRAVRRDFKQRRIRRPVAVHVREGLDGHEALAVDVGGVGYRLYEVPAASSLLAAELRADPKFALGHVVVGEKFELVGLSEHGRRADPRAAGFGVPPEPVGVGACGEVFVVICAERLVAGASEVRHELVGRLFAPDSESGEHGQPFFNVVSREFFEVCGEIGRPCGNRTLPAHCVKVRKGFTEEPSDILFQRTRHAAVVPCDRFGVEHVDVVIVPVERRVGEAHVRPLPVIGRLPFFRSGDVHNFDGVSEVGDARIVGALSGGRLHRVEPVAGVQPAAALGEFLPVVPHRKARDLPKIFSVGGFFGGEFGLAFPEGGYFAYQPLGRVRADFPRALEPAGAVAEVCAGNQPEPRGLLHGKGEIFAPRFVHELALWLGVEQVARVLPVSARVEQQESPKPQLFHFGEVF